MTAVVDEVDTCHDSCSAVMGVKEAVKLTAPVSVTEVAAVDVAHHSPQLARLRRWRLGGLPCFGRALREHKRRHVALVGIIAAALLCAASLASAMNERNGRSATGSGVASSSLSSSFFSAVLSRSPAPTAAPPGDHTHSLDDPRDELGSEEEDILKQETHPTSHDDDRDTSALHPTRPRRGRRTGRMEGTQARFTLGGRDPAELVAGDALDACHVEAHAGYDGASFTWGMSFRVVDAAECCAACRAHARVCGVGAGDGDVKHVPFWRASRERGETECGAQLDPKRGIACNVWVFCPEETCWANDIHNHTRGECWLKHQEDPTRPYSPSRGRYPEAFRRQHPTAPDVVQWTSGVLVPPGTTVVPGEPSWGKALDA